MNFIYFISFFIVFFLFIFYKKKNNLYIDQNQNKKFDTNINDEFIVPNIEQNSEIKEINSIYDKIIVICPIHGRFIQTANNHMNSGKGCRKCAINKITEERSMKIDEFKIKSFTIFGDNFDYSKCVLKNMYSDVIITCIFHGDFKVRAGNHLFLKQGCPHCSKKRSKAERTIKKILSKAKITRDNIEYMTDDMFKSFLEQMPVLNKPLAITLFEDMKGTKFNKDIKIIAKSPVVNNNVMNEFIFKKKRGKNAYLVKDSNVKEIFDINLKEDRPLVYSATRIKYDNNPSEYKLSFSKRNNSAESFDVFLDKDFKINVAENSDTQDFLGFTLTLDDPSNAQDDPSKAQDDPSNAQDDPSKAQGGKRKITRKLRRKIHKKSYKSKRRTRTKSQQ